MSKPVSFVPLAFGVALSVLVCGLAILTWGQDHGWSLTPFNSYRWFPLFGLLAFSLMWTHYVVGFVRDLWSWDTSRLNNYFEATHWAVLILLLLHPGLLIYQLARDGMGLPPESYINYVRPGLGWVSLLGTVSLLAFLTFELRHFLANRSWWHWVLRAGDIAMLAIFYHGLRLGSQIHGWYRGVWWFYGLTLFGIIGFGYYRKYRSWMAR